MAYIKKLVMHGFKSFAQKTEIIFDKGINILVGPNGSGKCLTEGSLVQLADGSLEKIGDLVNSKLDMAVKTEDGYIAGGDGTEVLCLDLESLKVIKNPIKAFIKKTSPEKLLKIKTRSGREITSTKYHPFFVLKEGKVVAAKAEELKEGTRIAVPRIIPFTSENKYFTELLNLIKVEDNIYIPYKEEYKTLLISLKGNLTWKQLAEKLKISYYIIKGLLDKQAIKLGYLIKILGEAKLSNIEIIDLLYEIRMNGVNTKFNFQNSPEFSRFFGYILAEGRLAESSQIWFTNGDKEIVEDYIQLVRNLFNKEPLVREYKPNCWDVIIFSEPLKLILAKLGMASQTGNKNISNIILKHSSEEEIANLLNGLYSGDGYVSHKTPIIEITTKSEKLAKGIETCLLRLGMIPRSRKVIKGIKSLGFSGEYIQISLYGVEMLKQFSKFIQINHNMKRRRIIEHLNKKPNPNVDLIEVNSLVKSAVKSLKIPIKPNRYNFPRLESYYYNGCTPSRSGVQLLLNNVLTGNSSALIDLQKLAHSDIFWDELEEIEEINGTDWVYDLTVEKDHNFIANNIFAHNSNISDAICFVLGRLSIKSMRAAKSKNLIFMGSKYIKPAHEASVELIFDNTDRAFNIEKDEIIIRRAVRRNGLGIYKINGETKTRTEIIEMLAHAGIDPHGFNLILQGQIQSIVRMHPEDRRKIIEEVAGISIYEFRKAKSLHELEKTDERLKEINTVLKERTAFLKNLEREKSQAEKFKELELTVKRCKVSILGKKIDEKTKESDSFSKSVNEKVNEKNKIRGKAEALQGEISSIGEKTNEINRRIQEATGLEQENLHNEISNLKAEIEGLRVRKENYEHRKEETERRIEEVSKGVPELEKEIKELKNESPLMAQKAEALKKKKEELFKIEEEKESLLTLRTELNSIKEIIKDKERQISRTNGESSSLLKSMEEYSINLRYRNREECAKNLGISKKGLDEIEEKFKKNSKEELKNEKEISVQESIIENSENVKKKVKDLEICPVCQSKISEEHIKHVFTDSNEKIEKAKKTLYECQKAIHIIENEKEKLSREIKNAKEMISGGEIELMKHRAIDEKKEQLKRMVEQEKTFRNEIEKLEHRRRGLELKVGELGKIEIEYDQKMLEIEEISSRTEEDVDTTLLYKEREIENINNIIKQSHKNLADLENSINETTGSLENKEETLADREEKEEDLTKRFKKMFEERDNLQRKGQEINLELNEVQNEIKNIDEQINYLRIGRAQVDAQKEALEMEIAEFSGVELIKANVDVLEERLKKAQETLMTIGSINMRALEVYDKIKKEYDLVQEKVNILGKEKDEILKIIEEIDKKKKKEFMKTFNAMNDLFTKNFSRLSNKGTAYLEIDNKEDIFSGGVSIIVKLAKGKYFDVTSLSGGEQTLVALSLLFAIQEHKPYHFYVFDEIDAALDKRNSERLAALLDQYMKAGQYIVITHNDALIMNSNVLYGISMHDGVSKIFSLKVS